MGHRRSPDDCPGAPLATSASSLQAATSPAQPRIDQQIGRRLRGQTGRRISAPDRRPWAEVANEVRGQVQAVIDTEREFRTTGDVAAFVAGDIVPHGCHTPGASTVSGGNSRANPRPTSTIRLVLLRAANGYRPSKLVTGVRSPSLAPTRNPKVTPYHGPVSSQQVPGGAVHTLPADLRDALLANATALCAWKDITPLARNEFICWVEDAKQQMSRERRIRRTQEELEEGQRRPCCWPGCKHRGRTGR